MSLVLAVADVIHRVHTFEFVTGPGSEPSCNVRVLLKTQTMGNSHQPACTHPRRLPHRELANDMLSANTNRKPGFGDVFFGGYADRYNNGPIRKGFGFKRRR